MATATFNSDHATTTFSNDNNSRVQFLKQRFSGIIKKAQLTLAGSTPNKNDNDTKKNGLHKTARSTLKKRAFETTVICEKPSMRADTGMKRRRINEVESELERKKNMRKVEIERMRAAARQKIEGMRNDSGICDPQEVIRDFAKLIGCDTATGRHVWPDTGSFIHQEDPHFENAISGQGFQCCKDGMVEVEEGEITDRDW